MNFSLHEKCKNNPAQDEFAAALAGLFPPEVAMACSSPEIDHWIDLWEEARLVEAAAVSRRRDYACGRACAHRALGMLGAKQTPILRGPDGEPLWPDGYTGAITHCPSFCGAVAGSTTGFLGLGFDAEPLQDLSSDVLGLVCHADEAAEIVDLESRMSVSPGVVAFSAKESIIKCLGNRLGRPTRFRDFRIVLRPRGVGLEGVFHAKPCAGVQPDWPQEEIAGRWIIALQRVHTGVAWRRVP